MTHMDVAVFARVWAVAFAASLAWFLYTAVKLRDRAPTISDSDIRYQERAASGHSKKNLLTSIGGARNCLRLVVTDDLLWITSWFPFTVVSSFYDLEHVIPLTSITNIRKISQFGTKRIELDYKDVAGVSHSIVLGVNNETAFLQAIRFDASAEA